VPAGARPIPTLLTGPIYLSCWTRCRFRVTGWIANVDGLNWFLDEVWQALDLPGISLDIYGRIDQGFRTCVVPGVQFHGFVASLADIYASVDIVINPVRFGAGLKIKTVEAMAAGRPLVTSAERARGLTEFDKKAFLIAENASAFRDALARLIDSELLRQTLRDTALAYVQKNLSPDRCFADLLARIDAH
jgi:glycosyltransferase involved in cell wall biosynthesis